MFLLLLFFFTVREKRGEGGGLSPKSIVYLKFTMLHLIQYLQQLGFVISWSYLISDKTFKIVLIFLLLILLLLQKGTTCLTAHGI